ncbi:FecR/PupR family sigma factor regulator [Methylorubrum suomiense]
MDQHAAGDADEPGQDPIFAEAALWVARLSSADATEADRAAFEVWQSADPAHADAYAELSGWRRTMGLAPPPRSKARRAPKGVALLAAALGLAGLITHELGLFDRLRADAWTGVGASKRRSWRTAADWISTPIRRSPCASRRTSGASSCCAARRCSTWFQIEIDHSS